MARYGKKAGEKVEKSVREMKRGKLKSGSGKKVTNPKQAVAIGLSEARKAGGKVPAKKKTASKTRPAKRTPAKKAAKKTTARKTTRRGTAKKKNTRRS